MLAFGLTGSGTGSCNSSVGHFGVTQGCNFLLSNDDFATYGAVLAFGLTGSSTGSCNSSVGHFGVTQCLGLVANVAVAAGAAGIGGITAVQAVRSSDNCVVAVTQSSNILLRNQDFTATVAVLALSLTGVLTGSCNSSIDHFIVTQSRNLLLCFDGSLAAVAVPAVGQTGVLTVRLAAGNQNSIVTQRSGLGIGVAVLADRTGMGGVAAVFTGRSRYNGVIAVTQGCSFGIGVAAQTGCTGMGGVAAVFTVRLGHNSLIEVAGLIPSAGGGVVDVIAGSICRNGRAVSIGQNAGNQSDFRPAADIRAVGNDLIGFGFGAGVQLDAAGAGGVDVGTAGGSINIACGSINAAVHLHQGILQSAHDAVAAGHILGLYIGQVACAGIAVGTVIVQPLIQIVNNDLLAGA